jgi:hypothetical protein
VGNKLILSGNGVVQVVVVGSGGRLRLDALTVVDGFASVGGGIVNNADGTLAVFNSTFSGNIVRLIDKRT